MPGKEFQTTVIIDNRSVRINVFQHEGVSRDAAIEAAKNKFATEARIRSGKVVDTRSPESRNGTKASTPRLTDNGREDIPIFGEGETPTW
jgi:hypothetical protein